MPINHEKALSLIGTSTVPDLGPERRQGTEGVAGLNGKIDTLLKHGSANSPDLLRALVLLWHDHLGEAHELAQAVDGADGAFVHGIMHRREPDYGNAAYWFRRVGNHPALKEIGSRIARIPNISSFAEIQSALLPNGTYDPFSFINLCEGYARRPANDRELLREVQAIETKVLLERFIS